MKRNGKRIQLKEGKLKICRESDQFIVLGKRESRSHAYAKLRRCRQGEGIDGDTKLAKETLSEQ